MSELIETPEIARSTDHDGRTYWFTVDMAWLEREAVVLLRDEHGPAGPLALIWLQCRAKAQMDGGWVRAGWRSGAIAVGVDADTMRTIVATAVEVGAIDELRAEGREFVCRLVGWAAEQERHLSAERSARYRARRKASRGERDAASRNGADSQVNDDELPAFTVTERDEA